MSTTTNAPVPDDALTQVLAGALPMNTFIGLGDEQIQAIAALGFVNYQQGRMDDARQLFEGLTALDSTSYFGHAGLGAIALFQNELEAAETHLRDAAERNPKDPTVLANLGETLLRQAKTEEAASFFKKSLDLDPDNTDPGANRARAILHGMQVVIEELKKTAQ
jgi:Flp pilus assembly protein TadD